MNPLINSSLPSQQSRNILDSILIAILLNRVYSVLLIAISRNQLKPAPWLCSHMFLVRYSPFQYCFQLSQQPSNLPTNITMNEFLTPLPFLHLKHKGVGLHLRELSQLWNSSICQLACITGPKVTEFCPFAHSLPLNNIYSSSLSTLLKELLIEVWQP